MSLAEYFVNLNEFAQAEYLVYTALKLVSDDLKQEQELRAMI